MCYVNERLAPGTTRHHVRGLLADFLVDIFWDFMSCDVYIILKKGQNILPGEPPQL